LSLVQRKPQGIRPSCFKALLRATTPSRTSHHISLIGSGKQSPLNRELPLSLLKSANCRHVRRWLPKRWARLPPRPSVPRNGYCEAAAIEWSMQTKASIELDAGTKTFASGLLPELIAALRRCGPGDLLAVTTDEPGVGADLETWCRFTRNALIDTTVEAGRTRCVIRCGEPPANADADRPVGSRLWLYANFDCNLHCDYCCVRSSPKAPRRALGIERVQRIAIEAAELGVSEIFVTGGEPFLLADIGEILAACAAAAPTTVLTNGMLIAGRRLEALRSLPRDRVTLQISLDSPTPERHDRHRGEGTWVRAWRGIERTRAEGFRVRLAATVSTDDEADEFRRFLDAQQIEEENRVIRRIALRGFATDGVALARADLVPEITITAEGVYWHPVGAEDADLLVTSDIFPLAESFAAVRRAFARESEHRRRLATIFNCA
jgi:pyruvate-formate lyase-activating enzyme/TusA-related sulfurtransferase